jgi:hypothetical protein
MDENLFSILSSFGPLIGSANRDEAIKTINEIYYRQNTLTDKRFILIKKILMNV